MDAKGELVAHAHDDRVGLVPFIPAQVRENLAMFVGRAGHESGGRRVSAPLPQRTSSPLQKSSTLSPKSYRSAPSTRVFALRMLRAFPAPNAPRLKVTSPGF